MKALKIKSISSNRLVLPYIKGTTWYYEACRERVFAEMMQLKDYMDQYDAELKINFNKIYQLHSEYRQLQKTPDLRSHPKGSVNLQQELSEFRNELSEAYLNLKRRAFRNYLPTEEMCQMLGKEFEDMRLDLVKRFESATNNFVTLSNVVNKITEGYTSKGGKNHGSI